MADIQFQEEQQYQQYGQAEQKPFMIRLVLKTGIVSTDDQAKYVLLGVAALAVVLAFMVPLFTGGSHTLTPAEKARALSSPGMGPGTFQ